MPDYKKIYIDKQHSGMIYQTLNNGLMSLSVWAKYLPETGKILELGCGNGILCRYLGCIYDVTGIDVVGKYDCSGYRYIEHDITQGLPFDDDEFDLGLSFDVLEHIEESEVMSVVSELARVSKRQVVGISHAPTDDKELHLTVKPPEWWLKQMSDGWDLLETVDRGNKKTGFYTASLIIRNCDVCV